MGGHRLTGGTAGGFRVFMGRERAAGLFKDNGENVATVTSPAHKVKLAGHAGRTAVLCKPGDSGGRVRAACPVIKRDGDRFRFTVQTVNAPGFDARPTVCRRGKETGLNRKAAGDDCRGGGGVIYGLHGLLGEGVKPGRRRHGPQGMRRRFPSCQRTHAPS